MTSTSSAGVASGVPIEEEVDDDTHVWEQPMTRSWESIQEDEKGELKSTQLSEQRAKKARIEQDVGKIVEKVTGRSVAFSAHVAGLQGMIRYLYVILDFGSSMDMNDFKPNRRELCLTLLEQFIKEFFDQNPISQLGFIITYDKVAEKVTDLSGNPQQQIQNLRSKKEGGNEISLQNALENAESSLAQIPSYGSREVLILMGALGTCDPGDINQTMQSLKRNNIRCSIISLSAEVYVCKTLASMTGGTCHTALNREHLQRLLFQHVPPTPVSTAGGKKAQRRWIHMGFPHKKVDTFPTLCACHNEFKHGGFVCPKCNTKFCELPTDCKICGLTLISSPHLARSYHHLFPVPVYDEVGAAATENKKLGVHTGSSGSSSSSSGPGAGAGAGSHAPADDEPWTGTCYACQREMRSETHIRVQCKRCRECFCVDCDVYIHSALHNCPGCESRPAAVVVPASLAAAGTGAGAGVKLQAMDTSADGGGAGAGGGADQPASGWTEAKR